MGKFGEYGRELRKRASSVYIIPYQIDGKDNKLCSGNNSPKGQLAVPVKINLDGNSCRNYTENSIINVTMPAFHDHRLVINQILN